MVSYISGCDSHAWYNRNYDNKLPMLPNRDRGYPNPTHIVKKKHFLIARNNLLQMGWIGIFEKLEQSIKQMPIYFGNDYIILSQRGLKNLNQNINKPKYSITKNQLKTLIKYNQFDILLYNIGVVLHQQQQVVAKYKFNLQ